MKRNGYLNVDFGDCVDPVVVAAVAAAAVVWPVSSSVKKNKTR